MRSCVMWRDCVLLLLGTVIASPLPAAAQETASVSEDATSVDEQRGPSDRIELEAFLDGLMAAHRADHDIVGATVAVVRDGEILLARGYGYSDRAERTPVDPYRTLFRIGSVSKLFTWTAVMQLVEDGRLDLDADVETYLDFEIPDTYDEPITLRHLLTHTPGFEDRALYLFGETDLSRRDYLVKTMPARVRPPGTFVAYSNYGTVLAGHVVERVVGTSWEDYVDRHILDPLEMEYATAHQPLPERLASFMSVGYANAAGSVEDKEFEIIEGAAPAGSISASAGAMAKFMIAYLQYGRLGEVSILEEETARQMLERAFTHDERLNGMALGFYEKSSHGLRILGHGGDTGWFHTDLAIVPSEDLGVFVSYNTAAGGQLSFGPFLKAFLDHYYPMTDPPAAVPVERAELEQLAGVYRFNRDSYTTFEKAFRIATRVTVGVTEDDRLLVSSPLGPQRFYHVGGGLYREVDGPTELAFRRDENGDVTHAFLSLMPIMALERVGPLSSPTLQLTLLAIAIGVMVVTLVSVPVAWYLRRRYHVSPGGPGERRARLVALLVAIVDVAFVIGAFALLAAGSQLLLSGEMTWITVVLSVGVLAAILTFALLVSTVLVWRRHLFSTWGRLRYTVVAAAAVVFLIVLNAWNLLGYKLG